MKRLFIAINLPDEVKNRISKIVSGIETDFRWIPSEKWHLTLAFLDDQPDEAFSGILEALKQIAKKYSNSGIDIEFDKIILAPSNKPSRMIWLTTTKETSKILNEIKIDLEDALVENGVRFKIDSRPFNGHLTLARFQFAPKNFLIPQLTNSPIIQFTAESIDLMESYLKRTGAEYEILSKFAFIK